MPIYWTLSSVPELAPLPEQERRRLWKVARWKLARSWQFWAVGLVGALSVGVVSSLVLGLIPFYPMRLVAEGAVIGVYLLVWERAALSQARPYIREALLNGQSTPQVDA